MPNFRHYSCDAGDHANKETTVAGYLSYSSASAAKKLYIFMGLSAKKPLFQY